jgi:hypothetical protein
MATLTEERISVSRPDVTRTEHRRSPVFVALGVVVAALLGFGLGWLAFRDTGADVPAEVQEVIDAYEAAWNELDAAAADAVMAPGARHYSLRSQVTRPEGMTSDDLVSLFSGGVPDGVDLEIERVHGDLPYVVVSNGTAYGETGTSITYMDEINGELLILEHMWLG